jgi:hypothetical protein
MMDVSGDRFGKALLIPPGVPLGTEKDGTLVVVDTVNFASLARKIKTDFRTDQAG